MEFPVKRPPDLRHLMYTLLEQAEFKSFDGYLVCLKTGYDFVMQHSVEELRVTYCIWSDMYCPIYVIVSVGNML